MTQLGNAKVTEQSSEAASAHIGTWAKKQPRSSIFISVLHAAYLTLLPDTRYSLRVSYHSPVQDRDRT